MSQNFNPGWFWSRLKIHIITPQTRPHFLLPPNMLAFRAIIEIIAQYLVYQLRCTWLASYLLVYPPDPICHDAHVPAAAMFNFPRWPTPTRSHVPTKTTPGSQVNNAVLVLLFMAAAFLPIAVQLVLWFQDDSKAWVRAVRTISCV